MHGSLRAVRVFLCVCFADAVCGGSGLADDYTVRCVARNCLIGHRQHHLLYAEHEFRLGRPRRQRRRHRQPQSITTSSSASSAGAVRPP